MSKRGDVLISFGRRVRQLRQNAGYSQEAFAGVCGLDRTYIGGIERGERNVSLRNIALLAKALNCSIAELFEGISSVR
jgi:transcriptional regulator with XRE-family HTH domain